MQTHVVILGAGFGGLELATRLSDAVADKVRVTLIDKSPAFMFGFAPELVTGWLERAGLANVRLQREAPDEKRDLPSCFVADARKPDAASA